MPGAATRHRIALAAAAVVAAAAAGVFALTGATAQADAPPASAGRVLELVYAVRRAPDPPPPAAFTVMPTVSTDPQPLALDPALESVQAAQAVQAYDAAQARESRDLDAVTRRAFASADATLALLPHWPETTEPTTPAEVEPASQGSNPTP